MKHKVIFLLLLPFWSLLSQFTPSQGSSSSTVGPPSGSGWGMINKEGKLILKPDYDKIIPFLEGVSVIKNEKGGFANYKGEITIQPQFDSVCFPREGFICFELDEKWGFINEKGEIVIQPQMDAVGSFYKGIAQFQINKKWGLIDTKGQFVAQPQFDELYGFPEEGDLARFRLGQNWAYYCTLFLSIFFIINQSGISGKGVLIAIINLNKYFTMLIKCIIFFWSIVYPFRK